MSDELDRQGYTPVKRQEQDIFNASFDENSHMLGVRLVCRAIGGPNDGELICLNAKWNETIGDYELLTAGSGGTSTVTYSYYLLEDGTSYYLQEDGTSKYILG